jgi:hypothetical protein
MPHRCPVPKKSVELDAEVRLLLRSRPYEIYFAIREEAKSVRAFHVWHWAMNLIEADELEDLVDETDERCRRVFTA